MANKNTEMRSRILAFVQAFNKDNGKSPSFREIGNEVGRSSSTISEYISRMASEGLIARTSSGRSITIK